MTFFKTIPLLSMIVLAGMCTPLAMAAETVGGSSTGLAGSAAAGGAATPDAHTFPLTVDADVSHQVAIQAVLIPANLAHRIFGKEVSDRYAVVELIISNRDSKASLVVQSIFLDYSRWLLNGNGQHSDTLLLSDPDETATLPSQVASVESRLVRGELLDAQAWTRRNWTMRTMIWLGTLAVGFEFPFSTDVQKGIGAWNGAVVPASQTLWPDGTIPQINRISDVGFQTNKVIPKESADIVVAFFPLNRFLTKGFRDQFLHNTAAWFVPKEMLADPKTASEFERTVGPLAKHILEPDASAATASSDLRGAMVDAILADCSRTDATESKEKTKSCSLQRLLDGVSLNRIHVVLHGVMTVDERTIPPILQSVKFTGAQDSSLWTKTGADQAGTIHGLYLSGGTVSLVDANGDAIDGATAKVVEGTSTDTQLNFTIHLTKCVPSSVKAFLVVSKKVTALGGTKESTSSTPFELSVQPASDCSAAPASGATPAPTGTHGESTAPSPAGLNPFVVAVRGDLN